MLDAVLMSFAKSAGCRRLRLGAGEAARSVDEAGGRSRKAVAVVLEPLGGDGDLCGGAGALSTDRTASVGNKAGADGHGG